jgi:Flp pilus assembly protein TadD
LSRSDTSTARRSRHLLLAVPLVLAALAYAGSLRGELQLDDRLTILENPRLRDLGWVGPGALLDALSGGRTVIDLVFALDQRLGGGDPLPFHLTSLVLHLATVALLYLFTLRTLERAGDASPRGVALAVAGLAALHPIQTQAVAYATQCAEVLASLAYVVTLLLLARAEERGRSRAALAAWAGAVAVFAIGLGAKPIVVTLPAVYLLYAWLFVRPGGSAFGACSLRERPPASPTSTSGAQPPTPPLPRRGSIITRVLMVLPLVALAVMQATGVLRSVEGQAHTGFEIPGLPWPRYFLTEWRVLVLYLRLLLWPAGQNVDHDFAISSGLGLETALAGALLLAIAGLGVYLVSRPSTSRSGTARVAGFGLLWFFALLAPTSSFVPLADPVMEHRLYLASWGLFVAVALGARAALARLVPAGRASRVAAATVAVLWLALGAATFARAGVWETRLSLWSDAVAKSPGRARPHLNLGHARFLLGDMEGAIAEYRAAAPLTVDGTVLPGEVDRNLGAALLRVGREREALPVLERAVRDLPLDADAHNNLALCYLLLRRPADADVEARRALTLAPGHPSANNTMGEIELARGAPAGALPWFERAIALEPGNLRARYNLAVALERLGDRRTCAAWQDYAELDGDAIRRAAAQQRRAGLGCR